ncbi:MAG TPA: helix-turn-helix domain-containing protein [Draconibacterium sp.]|nr:helix-turn-helix domain-containing protein [Draconibacterium sp.]
MEEMVKLLLHLSGELNAIKAHLQYLKKTRLERFSEAWIDGQDVMQALHICKRTLHSWRESGLLPYSQIKGKFYYKLSDIENILEANHSNTKKSECHDK